MKRLNKKVFFPPLLFLIITLTFSFIDNEGFIAKAKGANLWILQHFGWLFSWSTFLFLVLLVVTYFSPLGKVRIGGINAKPILTKWQWFSITICTTIATGILLFACAEPLIHLHQPPTQLGLVPNSTKAVTFSMSTLFMHWTLTPYSMYTITALVFALSYYNLKQTFSIRSLLYPLVGNKAHGALGVIVDNICLYGLVVGMSSSLGGGILILSGGIETVFGIPTSNWLMGIITLTIVLTFSLSAASGLQKGIRLLSDINMRLFLLLAILIFLLGPTLKVLEIGWEGVQDYVYHFMARSTNINTNIEEEWKYGWTFFYLASWFAWTPITALFLGRLSVGYTVRDLIHFNLLLPALFSGLWLITFGGAAIIYDLLAEGQLYDVLNAKGEQQVLYEIYNRLPIGYILSIITVFLVFISYVTAADSNTSAMSAISSNGINPNEPEAPLFIKLIWGSIIGLVAWVMTTTAGIEGLKMLGVLGGFPALFLIIAVAFGLIRLLLLTNNKLNTTYETN